MCDTLVSLTDHGVLFAKNSDRGPNEAQVLDWQTAADHGPDESVACTWISIPQVARTHAVLLSRPWWMWGAEMGTNEHGVTIGNEAVYTTAGYGDPALLGMDLVRLGLERAATAEGAVAVMIDLLERHGQGGPCAYGDPTATYHNSFLVADAAGAIVLETAGRHWATELVTGRGRSISNGLTIAGFAETYADHQAGIVNSCAVRRGRTETAAATATEVADLFAALRDHGPTEQPAYLPETGALGAPCVHAGGSVKNVQTTNSWVADLRSAPAHWSTTTAAPCTSIFKPISLDQPRPSEPAAANVDDPMVGWWRHEAAHRLSRLDPAGALASFAPVRDRLEADWLAARPATADAFAQAEAAEARWLADLVSAVEAGALTDHRPDWLRRHGDVVDAAAGHRRPHLPLGGTTGPT